MDDEKKGIIISCIVGFFFFLLILFLCSIPRPDFIRVKEKIAKEYNVEYSGTWELNSRVKFYKYKPMWLGDKQGYFYEIDGNEFPGNNYDINREIDAVIENS